MAKNEVTLVVMKVDGTVEEKTVPINNLKAFQNAVGGYIEVVPHLTMFDHNGTIQKCIALCDEEGKLKGKAVNVKATRVWANNLSDKVGIPAGAINDVLVGDVAFIYGPDEVMAQF